MATIRRRHPPSPALIVKVRTLADILASMRTAWETGHRGAILDALRACREQQAPLPEWLAQAVEQVVAEWSREAPTGKRGRQARAATARIDAVEDLRRHEFYENQRRRGRTRLAARSMTAEWFRVGESTIRDSLRRVKRMPPGQRYLAHDDRVQALAWLRSPYTTDEIRRWAALEQQLPVKPGRSSSSIPRQGGKVSTLPV